MSAESDRLIDPKNQTVTRRKFSWREIVSSTSTNQVNSLTKQLDHWRRTCLSEQQQALSFMSRNHRHRQSPGSNSRLKLSFPRVHQAMAQSPEHPLDTFVSIAVNQIWYRAAHKKPCRLKVLCNYRIPQSLWWAGVSGVHTMGVIVDNVVLIKQQSKVRKRFIAHCGTNLQAMTGN